MGLEGVDWIHIAHDRVQWRVLVSSVAFQELFGPPAHLEMWPLFLPFSCYNMQT
jgi:hypothetical protein